MNRLAKRFVVSFVLSMMIVFNFNSSILIGYYDSDKIPVYGYKIIQVYPHDTEAFTQGLVFKDGFLYEGTGLFRNSSLRKIDLESGKVLKIKKIPDRFFGEGITIFGDRIIQLTWKGNIGFVYNKNTFNLTDRFNYPYEGWGICQDGKYLIVSDGTSTIRFLEPDNFREISRITVQENGTPINNINELEYVKGEIYANIWQSEFIAKINPLNGSISGWIDLTGLLKMENVEKKVDVLNGIAYDRENDRLFVTGKLWPFVFEIELIK